MRKIMNRLKLMRAYECGPMDRCRNGGETWRRMMTPWLEERGVIVLDPTDKKCDVGVDEGTSRQEINRLKELGEYDQIKSRFQNIALSDLRMCDLCDFLIVHIDLDIYPCGTDEEIFTCNRSKKPIVMHVEQGKQHTPNWFLLRLPHSMIFSTWQELKDYLDHIDKDKDIDTLNRWRFFDLEQQTRAALGFGPDRKTVVMDGIHLM